jgi:hypothetical protein
MLLSMGVVRSTQDTQRTAGLSCDRMIMEYTHDEHCDMLLLLLVLLHRNARYAILVDVIQSLMCFDDRAAPP